MEELKNILEDVREGALPVSEIPGFIGWAFRKAAPVLALLVVIVFLLVVSLR